MRLLVDGLAGYLGRQVAAGAQVLQLFDSWVGCLPPAEYRARVLPHVQALVRRIDPGVPVILFGARTAGLLEEIRRAGAGVVGLGADVGLREAWGRLGRVAVMGNLDPSVLLGGRALIRREVRRILSEARGRPGHVFNLGHGVLPQTPVGHARFLVDCVHGA